MTRLLSSGPGATDNALVSLRLLNLIRQAYAVFGGRLTPDQKIPQYEKPALENELGQRLSRMVFTQMRVVLFDHLDARPAEQGDGQQVKSIDDQVRDR